MASFLEVPAPRGDLAEMQHAVAELDRTAGAISDGADLLDRVETEIGADWLGKAADAYALQSLSARDALVSVSTLHDDTARTVQRYADQWQLTHQASEQGLVDISDALGTYATESGEAVGYIVGRLEPLLDGAVGDLLSFVPGVGEVIDRLLSWSAPVLVPSLHVVTEDRVDLVSSEDVLATVQSGVDWGISRLLDGIEAVADLVGDLVGEAIGLFHQVEAALADAIAAAQRMVAEAMEALFEAGVEAAAALSRLALDVYTFGQAAVNATVALMVGIGANAVETTIDAATAVQEAMGLVVDEALDLWVAERRISADRADELDDAATARLWTDPAYQLHVDGRLRMSSWAYGGDRPRGLDGWDEVRVVEGTDGFAASVLEGPDGQVVVAYRGTEMTHLDDWGTDVVNGVNLSTAQGEQALDLAQEAIDTYGAENVQFTGHSLGGGLAAMAGLATGRPTTTFNAAGVGDDNYELAMDAGGRGKSQEQITNFYTGTDILTTGQDIPDPVHPAAGAQVLIESNTANPIEAHKTKAIFESIQAQGYKQLDEEWGS